MAGTATDALYRPGSDLLSRVLRRSTIGAGAFHGRVRHGVGCLKLRKNHQVDKMHRCSVLRISWTSRPYRSLPAAGLRSGRLHVPRPRLRTFWKLVSFRRPDEPPYRQTGGLTSAVLDECSCGHRGAMAEPASGPRLLARVVRSARPRQWPVWRVRTEQFIQ